jgi:ABC-type dipeptide/oligopeptide/nickel transport system permease component
MAEDTLLTDEQIEKKKKWAAVWDKVTTGLLIFLMASPIFILAYIFLWFIFR